MWVSSHDDGPRAATCANTRRSVSSSYYFVEEKGSLADTWRYNSGLLGAAVFFFQENLGGAVERAFLEVE